MYMFIHECLHVRAIKFTLYTSYIFPVHLPQFKPIKCIQKIFFCTFVSFINSFYLIFLRTKKNANNIFAVGFFFSLMSTKDNVNLVVKHFALCFEIMC